MRDRSLRPSCCLHHGRRPANNFIRDLAEGNVERPDISVIAAAAADRHAGLEGARGTDDAITVVQNFHEYLDVSAVALPQAHTEGADFGYHLIVDGETLARLSDPAEIAGPLERFSEARLYDLREAVRPLGALEELYDAWSRFDDDALAV